MMLLFAAVNLFMDGHWTLGCGLYRQVWTPEQHNAAFHVMSFRSHFFLPFVTWWNYNSIFLSFWQFSSVCENECAAFCSRAALPPPVWVWSNPNHPETFSVCSHTGKYSIWLLNQELFCNTYICKCNALLPSIISKSIRHDVAGFAGSAFPPGESGRLLEPGVWSWPSVYVQVDGQLALPARMALLESLLPLSPAGCPPAHPAALRSPPLEEVRLTLAVPRSLLA